MCDTSPPPHPFCESQPIAPREVIRFLIESEPLRNVTEVSRYLEIAASRHESHGRAMEETLNSCAESEKHIGECVEQAINAWENVQVLTKRRLSTADQVINRRFKDLHATVEPSCFPPLTTLPATSSMSSSRVIQMTTWVKEMGTSHRSMLTELELLKESIRATVDSVARFEESAVRKLSGTKTARGDFESTGDAGMADTTFRFHLNLELEALRDRCIQLSQDLSSSAKIITENHERICDQLSIFLKTRGESPNPTPRTTMLTLADELNGVQLRLLFDSFAVLGLQLRFLRTYMERRVSEWMDRLSVSQRKAQIFLQLMTALFVLLVGYVALGHSSAHTGPLPDVEGVLREYEIPQQPIRDALLRADSDYLDGAIRRGLMPRKP